MADDQLYAEDPKPLTRKELAEFLPTKRAIRAFEKLFDIVPSSFIAVSNISEFALFGINEARVENNRLRQRIEQLEIELATLRKPKDVHPTVEVPNKTPNLDPIIKRLELLESLAEFS